VSKGAKRLGIAVFTLAATASCIMHAYAHVSEQGIVLLLPTDTYIASGCLAVIFSMLVVVAMPHDRVFQIFSTKSFPLKILNPVVESNGLKNLTSITSFLTVLCLVVIGVTGTRDPLTNLLPLTIWTFFWIFIYMLHCVFGNVWAWLNPWSGIWNVFARDPEPLFKLSKRVGQWPAVILFFCFYIFIIVDLAPDDPARLANVVFIYLSLNFIGMFIFGRAAWLSQVEFFSVLFGLLSRLAPVQYDRSEKLYRIGMPGWKILQEQDHSLSQSFFLLTVLACGSFDGLNETFWWLAQIDINPLAFPGRSAVVLPSTLGMFSANLLVYSIFAIVVLLSMKLISAGYKEAHRSELSNISLFNALAISVLPITAAYHGSHYFISFLVNSQYLIAALSDPFANGFNYLGLENYQVTTGYLGEVSSVRRIWLTQAGMVVFGHILAVLMAHYLIARAFDSRKEAMKFHLPIAVFMATYTWFGLWLLAAPKGA